MTDKAYVIPADGLQVRDPATREPLPAEGGWKPLTTYWRRRIKCGDVTVGKPPKAVSDRKAKEG